MDDKERNIYRYNTWSNTIIIDVCRVVEARTGKGGSVVGLEEGWDMNHLICFVLVEN